MSEHFAAIRDEQGEQPVLDRRQMNRCAALLNGAQTQVDAHVAEFEYRAGRGARLLAAAGRRANPGQQLAYPERLGQIIVRAGIQRFDLVLLPDARRQNDHGNLRPAAQIAQELHPVAVRQAQVENDQIRFARTGVGQALAQGAGFMDAPAFRLQRRPHEAPDLALVLDENDDG